MSRRLMLRNASGGGGGILPPEYQQVEYIGHSQSTGIYLISPAFSGYIAKGVVDVEVVTNSDSGLIAFSRYSGSAPATPLASLSNQQSGFQCVPTLPGYQSAPRNIYELTSTSTSLTGRAAICGWNNAHWIADIKLYGVQFYNGSGTLIFDGVPCYRKSDGEIGLFDTVTQTLTGRVGVWTKGADV